MSTSPTPSVSSDQTHSYYDAPVMQFPVHIANSDSEISGSSSPNSQPRASGNPDGANQPVKEGAGSPSRHANDDVGQKSPSLRSLPAEPDGQEKYMSEMTRRSAMSSGLGRKESVRTTRSTRTTGTASAFANGAALTGPNAEPDVDDSLMVRRAKAERSLSQKQKNRITKVERKESRKFSRLLKTESTNEKVAIDSALKNLSALQNLHKAAMKRETKAEASHARALSTAQKAESRFQEEKARAAEVRARADARCIEERARWEGKEGELRAQEERLDSAREAVRDTETRIAECAREVERLRIVRATDEREREVRLTELSRQK